MLLPSTYIPSHDENFMKNEGDVRAARAFYLKQKPNNLYFLLKQRYGWMESYCEGKEQIYELGAGAGFSREFIKNNNLKLTDVLDSEWVDMKVDALNMPFADNSVDIFICSHMIHHVAYPKRFFKAAFDKLKPGGKILISEIYTSFFMKLLLLLMRHEGWSYKVDVFSLTHPSNQLDDPWSANCAITELLFQDVNRFEAETGFKIEFLKKCEFLTLPLSGGVIAKTNTIQLPMFLLRLIEKIDALLIFLFPNVFALGVKVVLTKPMN